MLFNIILTAVFVLNFVFAIAVIFLERRNVSATWAWLMILMLLPMLGFILYIVLGQNLRRRKVFRWDQTLHSLIKGESDRQLLQLGQGDTHFLSAVAREYQKLVYMHLKNGNCVYTDHNDVTIFTDGNEKFKALLQDIYNAEHHIHILYYIIRSDELGNKIADALIQKAKEGVQVRILYDASGSRRLSKKFVRKIKKAGGEIVAFFPIRIPLSFRLNYRNHRKIVVIDGKVGYTGGFNIGNEYIGLKKRFGYWRDTHIRIIGDAVNKLQARFILDWNQASGQKLSLQDYYSHKRYTKGSVGIQIVSSGPDSRSEHIKNGYISMIQSAQKNIYIQTPYFIPDESVLDALKIAASSGIDVRIMVPGISDHPFVYWASQSYFGDLLRSGAKIYRYKKGFLHAKVIVVDDKIASVGTANMDVRSFRLNFEVNAFLYSEEVAKQLADIFIDDIQNSYEITQKLYDERPVWVRMKESISRLLSPIL